MSSHCLFMYVGFLRSIVTISFLFRTTLLLRAVFCTIWFLFSLLWFLKVMWRCPHILTSVCTCLQRTLTSVKTAVSLSHLCAVSSGGSDHKASSLPDSHKCFSLVNSAHVPLEKETLRTQCSDVL